MVKKYYLKGILSQIEVNINVMSEDHIVLKGLTKFLIFLGGATRSLNFTLV